MSTGKSVLALLAGATIGAAVGILFAPEKGEKTRGKIKDGFDSKTAELKDKFDDLSSQFKSKISKVDLEETFDNLVANVDEKTSDVIETLERKLQELKTAASSFTKK